MKLIYLSDSLEATVDRILSDNELENCGLGKRKVTRCLKSFQGDEIACSVFLKKYALRDNDNIILEYTIDEAKYRWAKRISSAEKLFKGNKGRFLKPSPDEYFRELYEYYLPAGRQMFALGNDFIKNATLSNCYTTKIEDDSLEGIFDAAKKLARTYSYGGGTGICIGELRPSKSKVSNSARFSTGAVSFMELFSLTTDLIGQCIAKGERVLTKSGLKPIENITTNDEIWTKEGFISVSRTFKNGPKQVFKIRDQLGYEIKASKDHIFLTEKDGELVEKKLKDFNSGDPIILIPGTPIEKDYIKLNTMEYISKSGKQNKVKLPDLLDEKLAYILGYSYGDGSVEYDKYDEPSHLSLACSNDWNKIKEQLVAYIKDKFGYNSKISAGDGNLERIRIHSKNICNYLKNNDLLKQKSGDLIFPPLVLKSTSSVQMAFLAGYFDADGYSSGKKKGYVFSSICYKFLTQTKLVLMANGIITRNHFENRSRFGWRDLHSINVTGAFFQKRFIEFMGKSIKVRKCNHVSKRDQYLTPFRPKSLDIQYNKFSYCPDNTQYLSANCFNKLKKEATHLPQILIRSSVTCVTKDSVCETYDLHLERENIYFCEGFQVHNSGRRGALMITIPVSHPDIEHFIEIKHNNIDKVKYANISIKLSDNFMNAVIKDEEFLLSFETAHEKINKTVRAKELWQKIIQSARDSAEPGLLFWDRAVEMSPSDTYPGMRIHSTNPCAEQFLHPGSSCVLGSLLLHKFVINPFRDDARFDYDLFKEMVKRGVRHLDNIVELNFGCHGLKEQEVAAKNGRRIGLGITGLADTYAALKIKYDSKQALEFADEFMNIKKNTEYNTSINLAVERGSFPLYDASKHFERGFCKTLPDEIKKRAKDKGLRNVAISTIAPNGSLSIIAQCSSGIEPIFALNYHRFVEMGQKTKKKFIVCHQGLTRYFNTTNKLSEDFSKLPECWVVAHQVDYKHRVKLQGVLQKHIDASISSTINLPKDVDVETVGQIYIDAWKEGLKGITVYREGSREGILITDDFAQLAGTPEMDTAIHCVRAEGGDKFYILISYKKGDIKNPYQVFVLNYKRAENDAFLKISNALIRMLLTNGVPEVRINKYIARSTNSLGKLTRFISLSMKTNNFEDAVKILEEHAFAGTLASKFYDIFSKSIAVKSAVCRNPNCGSSNVRMEEGCMRCLDCDWSGCN